MIKDVSTLDVGSLTNFANVTGGQALGYVSLDRRRHLARSDVLVISEAEVVAMKKKDLAANEGLGPLTDNGIWINRVGIKSESSNAIYVVAEHRDTHEIHCSCIAGITKKNCKHIKARKSAEAKKGGNKFLNKYKTYTGTRGSPEDWEKAFGGNAVVEESPSILSSFKTRKIR